MPVIQSNTDLGVAGKVSCRCDKVHEQLTVVREIILHNLGDRDGISWKALRAELRFS